MGRREFNTGDWKRVSGRKRVKREGTTEDAKKEESFHKIFCTVQDKVCEKTVRFGKEGINDD